MFYISGNNHISSKECLNDEIWMKSLDLREVCGIRVFWDYSKTELRDQAHDGKMNGKEASQKVNWFVCS